LLGPFFGSLSGIGIFSLKKSRRIDGDKISGCFLSHY